MSEKHTLSVLVENKPGVLTRVSALFTRRGFNIHSLAVGPTEHEDISRITVIADAEGLAMEQVTKQLNKLVPVLKVVELEQEHTIARAIVLIKVTANNANRTQVVEAANLFRAHVVDVAPESVVIEATGTPSKLRALLDILEPFGIRELVQSGVIAMGRGSRSITDRALRSA